jgi:hypothetical protein
MTARRVESDGPARAPDEVGGVSAEHEHGGSVSHAGEEADGGYLISDPDWKPVVWTQAGPSGFAEVGAVMKFVVRQKSKVKRQLLSRLDLTFDL